MNKTLKRIWTDEEGLGFAEYGVILALAAVAIMVVVTPFCSD